MGIQWGYSQDTVACGYSRIQSGYNGGEEEEEE